MAETADDLSAPLGQQSGRKRRRFRLPVTLPQSIVALLGLFLAAFAGFALFNDNPLGGEPVARVTIPQGNPAADKAKAAAQDAPAAADPTVVAKGAPVSGQKTVTIIDGSSGARRDVVIGGDAPDQIESDSAPAVVAGIDQRLLEKSRFGMIPTVAAGVKPFSAYAMATDADRALAAKSPTIAIVIAGLGVGAAKTTDAIMKLPGAVTLAFTPYGSDPGNLVERARAARHEVLLQIPMEPFDYPDNDPGPQTLMTNLSPEQNVDRLFWHLSRFQGYVGLANFMGARFVTADAVMQPIMREAAKRGLGYFDDGSSPRSVSAALAAGQAMPFAKADASIDAVPTSAEIDRALAKLEATAKERGNAIGVASALPVTIDRIGTWAKNLAGRGILLVPLTTAMLKSKSG